MRDSVFLVFDIDGVVRMTKRWPKLSREEIGVQLRISIPQEAFKAPFLTVDLSVPEQAAIQPTIEIDVVEPPPEDPADDIERRFQR